ncbi:M13 family metallopeptidase [Aestuariimicrobium sp. T2.26MG-19.2B]|uniref:M13 family metallopeptidase n=1 Tax=Aestuariimicrobium sp. T2.26MG-19.2B TaxID=3040679 RepID=UPI002477C5C3|nr:M13-type metalloendopeptidase [Aestuariimicrobium sp. T2.26MG-19.2B]CAI9406080.1 Neutral endopeptidase [Aestuariimicrobium sp. T2.26MG-19.2B]
MTAALNVAEFDPTIRPQDDLFRHVNGSWLRRATIDADKHSAGAFTSLRDESEEAVRDIVTGLDDGSLVEGSEAWKIATLHATFMDENTIEGIGAAPLTPILARIDAISTADDLLRHWGWSLRTGMSGAVGFGVESDPGNPDRPVVFCWQGGLGLPDEEYYRADEHAGVREQYRAYVLRCFELAGVTDAEAQTDLVVDLETRIAKLHWDKVRTRDLKQAYNLQTWDEFTASSTLPWNSFLDAAAIDAEVVAEVVNEQPSFFAELPALVTEGDLPAWRAWARRKAISSLSPYLSRAFVDSHFDFYSTALMGIPEQRPRWKRSVGLIEGVLGEAIGRIYVERHFPPAAKERMDELVANLLEAYRLSIGTLDWMGEDTRAEALSKLSKFSPKIGYPTKWRDYSALEVTPGDLVANVAAASSFELDHELAKIGKPVDREEWLMTPQTVNAYYHPLRNEIVFPAAILQPPFFNVDADDAVNYGGIGAVIGHEIGHGFDDQGSTCDGDGRLRDWWTDDDRTAFEQLTGSLKAQYDALVCEQLADEENPPHVNGSLTIGENIGDLGGVSIALKAWRLAHPEGVDDIDGLTGEQRFFLSYATIWQQKTRDEALKQRLATDPHSPAEFRCNQIVRNVDAFYEAFGTSEADALWLPEDQRVSIW